jgi:hypothetical protein
MTAVRGFFAWTLLLAGLLCAGCSASKPQPPASPTPTPIPPTATPEPTPTPSPQAVFERSIRPILVSHCAPCHEPGGIMYSRLPFDDPKVLESHSAGALRRLKGEDRSTFEGWLASLPKADSDTKK